MSSASQMYTPLYFAKKAEARKYSRYLATARAMNHLFHPYALETFGSCGPMLDNTLKALADRFRNMTTLVSNSEVSEKSQLVRFWRVKISAALQRENSKLIISKANRVRSRSHQRPAHLGPDHFSNVWRLT